MHQYFTLLQNALEKCSGTKPYADPVNKVLDGLTRNQTKMKDLEDRQIEMRARITVCIFYLRKAIITLGKEIRKAELALKEMKIYNDFLPTPTPSTQIPMHQQLQAFIAIAEHALKQFNKVPAEPKCEPVKIQKEPLQAITKKSKELMKEYQNFAKDLDNLQTQFKNLRSEAHNVVNTLQKDLLVHFEYNTSDVTQYFLTLTF
ncbi:MAG: hypothetical protein CVU59_07280 [Deltaproteobacteria bacterium HGW-Deltaproteobacteria-17]|nr:MAG: hypothetical protein CVU59_07280 [Deltaproteobacteria bacterium HGW-Deltaproteobacteria-17]